MSVASSSTLLKFHELPSGTTLHSHHPKTTTPGSIRTISWSKDGNWLALVPHNGPVEVVSVKDQLKLVHTISSIAEPSAAAFQNTTKRNVVVGTKSGEVLLYDIKNRNVKKRFPSTTSTITRIEFTAKDNHIVAACENSEAYIYSNLQNVLSGSFKVPRSESISALRASPIKRSYVVAGSNEGVVAVWDIHSNKNKFYIGAHKAPITGVVFSPISTDLVVSAGLDRQLCIYDIGSNKCIANIFVENSMTAIDFSPDGQYLVTASHQGNIYIYEAKNFKQPVHTFSAHTGPIEHLAFRKCQDAETSFNISYESNKELITTDTNGNGSIRLDLVSEPSKSQTSPTEEDSFMAAIGGNSCNFSRQEYETTQKNLSRKVTPSVTKNLRDKILSDLKAPMTSTPEVNDVFTASPVDSPICTFPPEVSEFNTLKESIGGVKDEVKEMKTLLEELKFDAWKFAGQTREMFIDLLMFQVKESIKVEDLLNGLRAEVCPEVPQEVNAVFKENLMLKQRIMLLEEELSMLKRS